MQSYPTPQRETILSRLDFGDAKNSALYLSELASTASNPSIRSFNERAAVNARLQGTAADIIRRAMIRMDEVLARERLAAQMLLQVHDELVFQVPEDEIERTIPVVKRVMEEAPLPALALALPLHVEAHAADNWEEAH